ncbi:MAG: TolC family protein [Deltaproteobacteria bacterium]|nr:TolC family protein [Deltaproteobacteria bacterium]
MSFVAVVISWVALGAPPRVLALDEALELAVSSHPELARAGARVSASEARADQARAQRWPQLSATMGYERSTSNGLPGGASTFDSSNHFSLGLAARQLLYDFGLSQGRIDSANATAESAKADRETARLELLLDVRTAYFSARAAKALVEVAERTLTHEDLRVAQVEAFVQIGTRPEIDLVEARSTRADLFVDLVRKRGALEGALARLRFATGAELGAIDVSAEPFPEVTEESGTAEALSAVAIEARPELDVLGRQREALLGSLRSARSGYVPSLSLSARFSETGAALDELAFNLGGGVELNWSLFEGGATTAEQRAIENELSGVAAELARLRQRIRVEVEEALVAVRSAKAALLAHADARRLAEDRLRLAEGRYRAGAGSSLELGDASVRLATSLADGVRAENDLAIARARLLRALGR